MKKFLLRSTVFVLAFVITLVVASRLLNKDRDNLTQEMAHATLPVVTMLWGETEYNPLYGYVTPMDPAFQRDQITILGENRNTEFLIRSYGRDITKIDAQVRSGDGERLIETIEITQFQKKGDEIRAELALKDLIEKGEEYVISICLTLDDWQEAWYHTRAIWDPESLVGEGLAFVSNFHETLFHREEAKNLVKYLESNPKLQDNDSFHYVNIHSSFKQITWGDLKVTESRKPVYTVKEIHGRDASILVDFGVSTKGNEKTTYYRAQEFFKIRYSADRTYLLAYERAMTQIPDENALYGGDKLLLGIGDENVDMMESEDGNVVVFQQADRLFSFQIGTQRLVKIFSFYDVGREDAREEHDDADVKILSVDKDGSCTFAVYGYQSRGEREGENGIRICRYDAKINAVSETAFIPWDQPYSVLKAQMDQLLYYGQDQFLYLCLEQAVYRCDLKKKTYEKLLEIRGDGCMMASADHQILTWQEPFADGTAREILIQNLATNTSSKFTGGQDEVLRLLGFMGQDVIFGVAKREEIAKTIGGREIFPMYKLRIGRADGTLQKEYSQEGLYVTGCTVEENQIILERATRKDDGSFVDATPDHVTKTKQEAAGKNVVAPVDIDVYETYVQIKVNGKIDANKVQLLTPKEVIVEGAESFVVEAEAPTDRYLVYSPFGLEGSYVSASNAVQKADEISGYVIGHEGNLIWRKSDRSTRNQIMAISEPDKVPAEESMAVCLDVMLRTKGVSLDSAPLLEEGKTPQMIVQDSLSEGSALSLVGVSLDAMLYYVSKDLPVLAILRSGEGVLITGYNESQVVIFQPSAGKLGKRGMSDAAKWFEENDNCFLTFSP